MLVVALVALIMKVMAIVVSVIIVKERIHGRRKKGGEEKESNKKSMDVAVKIKMEEIYYEAKISNTNYYNAQ